MNKEKVTMPSSEEIGSLPGLAQNILNSFKDKMPITEQKYMARMFVDAANGEDPTEGAATIRYKNPSLLKAARNYSNIGEYNPDRIPIHTYEKMRLDPVIALATSFIEQQILSQNFRIDSVDLRNAAIIDAMVRPIYRKTVRSMLRSVQFGFTCGEKVYKKINLKVVIDKETGGRRVIYNDYAVVIDKVKCAYPASIEIIRDKATEEIEYVTQNRDAWDGKKPKKVKIEKCLWFAPESEYGNFFGNARYKAAYQPWYWSQILMQFALRYYERCGAPAIMGKAPIGVTTDANGNSVDNMDIILEAANALISNSAVAIPNQFDPKTGESQWSLEHIHDDQRGDMFLEMLRFLNILKARALFVPDKVGVAEGSSTNATAESHLDVHMLAVEALMEEIEDSFNTQIINDLTEFNFKPTKKTPCFLKIEKLNYSKRTLFRDVLLRMVMFSGSSIREGNWPSWMPDMKEISKLLEIPGSDVENLFLFPGDSDDNNNDNENKTVDKDTEIDKASKKEDANKDANKRKETTRRDTRARERA